MNLPEEEPLDMAIEMMGDCGLDEAIARVQIDVEQSKSTEEASYWLKVLNELAEFRRHEIRQAN